MVPLEFTKPPVVRLIFFFFLFMDGNTERAHTVPFLEFVPVGEKEKECLNDHPLLWYR